MKRLIIIIFLIFPLCIFSQKFNGGAMLGGLVSQVDGDNWEGYDKFGFLAGAYVSLRVSEHSSFQMEMEYIQKGARKNANLEKNDPTSYLARIHYLEIPLLYQYTFLKRVQAEAGPVADIFLGSYEESDGQEVPYITHAYRAVTLAGILGISCYITNHLKAGFRFNYSLISTRTEPPAGSRKILFEVGQYNNVLSLSLYWDFKSREF